MPASEAKAPLSPAARTLLGAFYAYTDLAEHLDAIPAAAEAIGLPAPEFPDRTALLEGLAERLAATRADLAALGLHPTTTTTTVEVVVNGTPIDLPAFCRDELTDPLSMEADSRTTEEPTMHAASDHPTAASALDVDEPLIDDAESASILATVGTAVRPYVAYLVTFTAGVVCGAVGAGYFGRTGA